jgi:hypothetical protein
VVLARGDYAPIRAERRSSDRATGDSGAVVASLGRGPAATARRRSASSRSWPTSWTTASSAIAEFEVLADLVDGGELDGGPAATSAASASS